MSGPLVLVTGPTGQIGFSVLALLLQKGYRTRVASRKFTNAERLKDLPSLKPYAESISVVEIPDFTASGAFDEAVRDVDYVQHIASPIPDGASSDEISDALVKFINPAVNGNLAVLTAALKVASIKRIVFTSSTEILDPKEGKTTIGPYDAPGPVPLEEVRATKNPHFAYRQSKRHSTTAVDAFMREHRPHFDVIHVLPSFVQGRIETVTTFRELLTRPSSIFVMIDQVLGGKSEGPFPVDLVLLDDVALTHVAAMESRKVKNGERYVAAYTGTCPLSWEDVDPIVERLFPEEVKSGLLPLGGKHPGRPRAKDGFDSSRTTEVLGVEFRGLVDMVQSVVGQMVELKKKESEN
ncbi:hypothetical protein MMC13_000820 [Lambiella insularis]|nr:hypothetical protein [Lambiella insularis]